MALLPTEDNLTNSNTTNAQQKNNFANLRNFIAALLGTDSSDISTAQAALEIPDSADLVHITGAETIGGVKTFTDAPVFPQSLIDEYQWLGTPIGGKIRLRTDLDGVAAPPTNNPKFRYVKLTASDAYNTGVLTSESVTGSAPLITATAVLNLIGSPMNGETIYLENTMRTFSRAGSSGLLQDDAMQVITGTYTANEAAGNGAFIGTDAGALTIDTASTNMRAGGTIVTGSRRLNFNSSNSPGARTANENRPRAIGDDLFMRVL